MQKFWGYVYCPQNSPETGAGTPVTTNIWNDISYLANDLEVLYYSKTLYTHVEPLYRRALAIDEKIHGNEHPMVAIRLNNLAQLLQATNQLDEAEPLMRRAVTIFEKSLPARHPNITIVKNNYAVLTKERDN